MATDEAFLVRDYITKQRLHTNTMLLYDVLHFQRYQPVRYAACEDLILRTAETDEGESDGKLQNTLMVEIPGNRF